MLWESIPGNSTKDPFPPKTLNLNPKSQTLNTLSLKPYKPYTLNPKPYKH